MTDPVYQTIVERTAAGVPFAFSRWGDGEWACLLGRAGATVDGQRYSGALRRDLAAVLEGRPAYWVGLQAFARRRFGAAIAAWLERRGLVFPWIDADVLARASMAEALGPWLAALRGRGVILVGPARLARVAELVPLAGHVIVPLMEAYAAVEDVTAAARAAVARIASPVVLVSAGPAAKLIVDRVARADAGATVIDTGSLWDPYVGLITRTYHGGVVERRRCA